MTPLRILLVSVAVFHVATAVLPLLVPLLPIAAHMIGNHMESHGPKAANGAKDFFGTLLKKPKFAGSKGSTEHNEAENRAFLDLDPRAPHFDPVLMGLLSEVGKVFGHYTAKRPDDSQKLVDDLKEIAQSGVAKWFETFGNLPPTQQKQIGNLFSHAIKVFDDKFLFKLNQTNGPTMSQTIGSEMGAIEKVLQKPFGANQTNDLLAAIWVAAPRLSEAFSVAYRAATTAFGEQNTEPATRKTLAGMKSDLAETEHKLDKTLADASPERRAKLGPFFNVLNNAFTFTKTNIL